jgi:hypothetical protein
MSDISLACPIGTEFGCLPRFEGLCSQEFGDGYFPTYLDKGIDLLPRSEWKQDIGIPDSFAKYIFSQLSTMCTSNGLVQGMMIARSFAGMPYEILSPGDVFAHISRPGQGSSLGDNIRVAMDIGVRTREQVPQDWPVKRLAGWREDAYQNRIIEAVDLGSDKIFDAVVTALHRCHPVLIGVTWPGGRQGHGVIATRYVNGKIRGPNSWGVDSGDKGFYELTERQCASMPYYGAFIIRVVSEADHYPQPPIPVE